MTSTDLAVSILSVHYMVARYPTGRPMSALCAGCEWTASFGSGDQARKAHAAHVLDVLNADDVTVVDADARLFAAATVAGDGTIQPVSGTFSTAAQAEEDLAALLGDDYYRDRHPFVATAIAPTWRPIEPAAAVGGA
ncbi:hypothetical protein [Mycolicibacterium sp.]|uniref:hypothetical protein n=1 Tax=Mycolicibacterium sp. TaxID=2320850 RepID=UPI0037C7D8D5